MAPRRSGKGCPKEQRDKHISANAQRGGYQHHHPSSSTSSAMSTKGFFTIKGRDFIRKSCAQESDISEMGIQTKGCGYEGCEARMPCGNSLDPSSASSVVAPSTLLTWWMAAAKLTTLIYNGLAFVSQLYSESERLLWVRAPHSPTPTVSPTAPPNPPPSH